MAKMLIPWFSVLISMEIQISHILYVSVTETSIYLIPDSSLFVHS
jgi:hypothetical protein